MATQVLNTRFQLKRGLAEAWNRNNPVLAPGEPGWTLDTHVLKIGDGVTAWKDLEPIGGVEINENDIQNAVNQYLEEHPVSITTDKTLSVDGAPADSAAVREQCVFNTD
jgi:hypothetical protein